MNQNTNDQTLFVVLPENIDDLLKLTEKSKYIATDFVHGYALYRYLFDRCNGMTHAETIANLKTLDYREAKCAYRCM